MIPAIQAIYATQPGMGQSWIVHLTLRDWRTAPHFSHRRKGRRLSRTDDTPCARSHTHMLTGYQDRQVYWDEMARTRTRQPLAIWQMDRLPLDRLDLHHVHPQAMCERPARPFRRARRFHSPVYHSMTRPMLRSMMRPVAAISATRARASFRHRRCYQTPRLATRKSRRRR